jgi:hypothetical protein
MITKTTAAIQLTNIIEPNVINNIGASIPHIDNPAQSSLPNGVLSSGMNHVINW